MTDLSNTGPIVESTEKAASVHGHPRPRLHWHLWLHRVTLVPHIVWLLTKDDFFTFVCPNTTYGIFAALSGSTMIDSPSTALQILFRLPWIVLFNWSNLLIFDLANQRLPGSVQEDLFNKPWRPVPSGRMTPTHVRHILLVAIPAVLAFNHLVLRVGSECALLIILTWVYNDLGGGDDHWMLRNTVIATAFWLYNVGSAKVAARDSNSPPCLLSPVGTIWTSIVSVVILTTMHIQDLKDQDGDRAKRRSTAPIVLGDYISRWTVAIPVVFWSFFCAYYWKMGVLGLGPVSLGLFVAWRCVNLRKKRSDRRTWELWALWTSALYSAPLLYHLRSPGVIVEAF